MPALKNIRHERFCREYCVDGNGSRSARVAGYPAAHADVTSAKLLGNARIRQRIDELAAPGLQKADINAELVLNGLRAMACFDPRRLFNDDGTLVPLSQLDDETAKAIAGFEAHELYEDGDGKGAVGTVKKYKLADRQKALEALGRTMALFKDVHQHTGLEGLAEAVAAVRERKARQTKE